MNEASKLITSVPGGRGYEDRVEHAVQTALNDRDAKLVRLRSALADLIEINRRDESSDPDHAATDTWREQTWKNAREALK